MRDYLAVRKARVTSPLIREREMPLEYLSMIYLPERGICTYAEWKALSVAERELLLYMLAIEAEPHYQRES